jgi:hypothetical protein
MQNSKSCLPNQGSHFADCFFQANENSAGNDRVPDVEFDHVRQAGNILNVIAMQSVAGIDLQAKCMSGNTGNMQPFKLLFLPDTSGVGIGSCVQFHNRGAAIAGCLELLLVWVDEQ